MGLTDEGSTCSFHSPVVGIFIWAGAPRAARRSQKKETHSPRIPFGGGRCRVGASGAPVRAVLEGAKASTGDCHSTGNSAGWISHCATFSSERTKCHGHLRGTFCKVGMGDDFRDQQNESVHDQATSHFWTGACFAWPAEINFCGSTGESHYAVQLRYPRTTPAGQK